MNSDQILRCISKNIYHSLLSIRSNTVLSRLFPTKSEYFEKKNYWTRINIFTREKKVIKVPRMSSKLLGFQFVVKKQDT